MAITKLFGDENVEYEGAGEVEEEVDGGAEGEEASDAEEEEEGEESGAEEESEGEVEAEEESGSEVEEVEEAEAESGSEAEAESGSASEGEGASEADAAEEEEESGTKAKKAKKAKNSKNSINISGVNMLPAAKPKTQGKSAPPIANYDDDDDDEYEDEEDDEFYLQKFDRELRDNFISDYHPEAKAHNYEEVKALARVSRDGRGIINDPLHKTIPFLTKYEMTRVVGQRAKQLDNGAKPFVRVPPNIIDGYHIALLEMEQKKIPFIIKRPYPNGGVEYWHVSDLELL
jgi:DNA-directed RNA polymerase subunit K/omega